MPARPLTRLGVALTRFLLRVVVRVIYRVRPEGLHRIPDEGAVLLVANHVTFIDALILGALCRRPARFVMHHSYYRMFGLRWFFRMVGAIPIAGRREDPALLAQAMETIDAALAAGEVVMIFPEGQLTRDGEMGPFRPGVERILARRPVPVLPMALRGLWGSVFSHSGRGPLTLGWPRWRARVRVVCGSTLPAEEVDCDRLYRTVADLRGAER